MTIEIVLMLVLVVACLVAFATELLPLEVTALSFMAILLALGIIDVDVAISGFSNKAMLTVGALFILSHALVKTRLLEVVSDRVSRNIGGRQWPGVGLVLGTVSLMSGILNNTPVVAIFIPLMVDLGHRLKISASHLLIPMSYAAIFGGTLTLVGTSTNLLVSAIAEEHGLPALGMFQFTPMGAVFVAIGLVYILLLARRVLPAQAASDVFSEKYQLGDYLTELKVMEESSLIGKTLRQADISRQYDITALAILRKKQRHIEGIGNMALKEGDILIVRGEVDDIMRLRNDQGVGMIPDIKMTDEELAADDQTILEVLITQNSGLIDKTPAEADFRRHYGAFVLAIRRVGATFYTKIARTRLRLSDTLLVMAPQNRLAELRRSDDFLVISEVDLQFRKERFWWLSLPLIPGIVLLAAAGVLDILEGAILGAVLMLVLGVVKPQEAYRAIDWSVLFLIAAFVPVGQAMVQTGTAGAVASAILSVTSLFPEAMAPLVAISLVYLATSLLTEAVSNNASAIIVTPICLAAAGAMEVSPLPFLMAVCFAASASFMTPNGYQTNMMVYGPGNYQYLDYVRFGGPLNLIFWLAASLLIPFFFPL
jgi:di/tricarboxylate transporter